MLLVVVMPLCLRFVFQSQGLSALRSFTGRIPSSPTSYRTLTTAYVLTTHWSMASSLKTIVCVYQIVAGGCGSFRNYTGRVLLEGIEHLSS